MKNYPYYQDLILKGRNGPIKYDYNYNLKHLDGRIITITISDGYRTTQMKVDKEMLAYGGVDALETCARQTVMGFWLPEIKKEQEEKINHPLTAIFK
jgi:hypothetical protein